MTSEEHSDRWVARPAPSRGKAVAIGLLVTFLWATSVVLIRLGLTEEAVDPIGFAGVRFALAAIFLIPLAAPRLRATQALKADPRWLTGVAIYGLLMFGAMQVAAYVALGELPAATIGLFMAMAPVVTAVLVLRSAQERAGLLQLAGIGILVVGVIVYFGPALPGGSAVSGLLAGAAIPLIVGGSARLGRHVAVASRAYGGPLGMTAIAMAAGASATLLLALVVEGVPTFSPKAWLLIIWMAAVNTAFAYTLWAQSQRGLRAVESSVLGDVTTVQIAVLGWIVLGETLDIVQALGLAVALAGVTLVQVAPSLRRRGAPATAATTEESKPSLERDRPAR